MSNLSGTPGAQTNITDVGTIAANINKGIICVNVISKRGKLGKEYLIGTATEYKRTLGGAVAGNQDYYKCIRGLNKGTKLRVNRVFHLTDQDDKTTVEGDIATVTATQVVVAVLAKGTLTFTSVPTAGTVINVQVNGVTVGTYTVSGTPSLNALNISVQGAVNTATGSNGGYTATISGNVVSVVAPTGSGAGANGRTLAVTQTGGTPGTVTVASTLTGGVTAVNATVDVFAEAVGSGYDGTIIEIKKSISNIAGKVDISVTLPENDVPVQAVNFDQVLTEEKAASLNGQLGVVAFDFSSLGAGFDLPIGTFVLGGGTQDVSLIDDEDFIGSPISKNGYHAFNDVSDSMRIWNISRPTHAANQGLVAYCLQRKDMRCRVYTPMGLTISGLSDYRNGTGSYNHQPIDSFYGDMWYTDVVINDPENGSNTEYSISGIGDQLANRSATDSAAGEWISDSGEQRGKLFGVNNVGINFKSPAYSTYYDVLYEQGVNAIVNHPTFKICNWGNRTMYLNRTSLLSKTNIADLVVFISREIKLIAERMSFQPNDLIMFNRLYRKARPFIIDTLINGRAIEGGVGPTYGEGVWWHWIGDQFAKNPNELKFNTKADYDAGKYRLRFAFKPIAANEYIVIDIAPADSVTIQNVQQLLTIQ